MQTGRHRSNRRWSGAAGIGMVSVGLLLLVAVAVYYGYGAYARTTLDDLNFEVASVAESNPSPPVAVSARDVSPRPPKVQTASVANPIPDTKPQQRTQAAIAETETLATAFSVSVDTQAEPVAQPAFREPPPAKFPASIYASMYPAVQIHPKYWDQPLWADSEPYYYRLENVGPSLPDGFQSVSAANDALVRGASANTTRISIPSIGVESGIKELEIIDLGSSRSYETPNNVVGHIPQSSNPGEVGNGWFFGHLESPIRGEGNIFQQLPNIPEMLRNGDDVHIELENENGHVFLYKVSRTHVVHEDDMNLYNSDNATITLVACVPRLVYDHRILVTAELVGVKDS